MESDTEVEKEDDPQLEEEDGVGGSSHYWLQLDKIALTNAFLGHTLGAPSRVTTSVRPAHPTTSPDPFLQTYLNWELGVIWQNWKMLKC